MNVFDRLWQGIVSRRWNRSLEDEIARQREEIARLRTENRALLNSILGIAGMKPLAVPPQASFTSFTAPPTPAGHSESSPFPRMAGRTIPASTSPDSGGDVVSGLPQAKTRNDSRFAPSSQTALHATPHRRRSWHQINRLLELQSTLDTDNS